jgi:predicted nucleic acid-binding protein
LAPASVHWEIGNAFSAMLKRNRIELDQALQAIAAYRQIPIRYVDVELEDTLAIAARYAIYAYDAYLIRCGLKFNAPLLSLDRGLLQVAEQEGVDTIEVG